MKQIKISLMVIALAGIVGSLFSQQRFNTINQKPHYVPEYSNSYTQNQLAPILKPGKVFYVSTNGDDKNEGTHELPFRTITAARNAVRNLKSSKGLPAGGVHVILMSGNYQIDNAVNFTSEDSGTKEAPIVYRGIKRGDVVLSGGLNVDTKKLKVVKNKKILSYLHPKAKGNVMSISLSKNEVSSYFPGEGSYGQISMNGHMLQLAQWPNRGYNHIGEILEEGPTTRWLKPGEEPMSYSKENPTGGKFVFKETLSPLVIQEFERTKDMRAQGYFHNDWYFQDEPVGQIENNVVQLLHHTRYGIVNKIKTIPRRVRLFNVLAELDEPGEWYFDKKEQQLYIWPIKGFEAGKSTLTIIGEQGLEDKESVLLNESKPTNTPALINFEDTEFITFKNLIIENTGDLSFSITGGKYNLIAGSTIRNGLGRGVNINGGEYNGISGCDFYDLYSAFSINGGDLVSLTPCYNFATNNIVRNCRLRGYGVIGLNGVGIYFGHNLLHDMNGAVSYKTVNLLMEYNEFYNIGYEMGDFNVAYCGAQWYTMNNVLRYNFVHHLIEPGGHPITGFRNDDNGAGMKVYGNVFYRSGRGSCIFHGFLNDFENNISIDAAIMWWTLKKPITQEGIQKKWDDLSRFGRDLPKGDKGDYIYIMEQKIGKDGWKKGVWKETFPELEETIDKNPWAQTNCTVSDNYIFDIRKPIYVHGGSGTVEGLESKKSGYYTDLPRDEIFEYPKTISLEAFENVETLNFSFKESFVPMENFKTIPFDNIGLEKDEFRTEVPNRSEYRSKIYERFKNDKGGRYNAKTVNSRYPVPSYLE
ncbi:right-handed parallel beta-helix repeat-containing protein [Tamlana fucoidanivorans]|uniref:Right-handed parallel beta-helix repeat-containing protein n=1 Tax=Allotamlana fucoidanivorans TaxID=2583814 RepID=A0A5C4SNV9_9FLAO|nr:right-handed parallel beta-helix repeat-containing protein [Tamlana fucoidanivorans]TNJ45861.1 right-handed parallel beta-helix repeat-containing protein [Tamlana fucoidanivorans]